ncbi:PadR family transcriptional regulator [Microbacterium trichothecenolyticum]|uniref:PadR family transcriptional regulator n=1 Tax=Microbacterium trichothecenolyticum TaxID=69370 RepID=UPI0035BE2CCA
MSESEILETHLQELRRGTVVLACLRLLETPGYGYGLLEELGRRGFLTDANTLYPLLRRLEKQGCLTSEWNTDESRPRKFYRTSDAGLRLAATLTDDFRAITVAIDALPDSAISTEEN